MAKISEIVSILETFAPLSTQEDWDNSGWQVKFGEDISNKVLIALNATLDVVKQASEGGFDLLITHHPLLFDSVNCVNEGALSLAVQGGVRVYAYHTNFDKADRGTSTILAQKIGFETVRLNDYVRIAAAKPLISLEELTFKIKKGLGIKHIKLANYGGKREFSLIAFSAGAGGDFIKAAKEAGADAFITSDIKYHEALDNQGIAVFDAGHFESEVISLEKIKELVEKSGVEAVIAKEEPVFEII